MNEEQKEPKYYKIRADIFWSVVALIIMACIVGALHFRKNLQSPEAQSNNTPLVVAFTSGYSDEQLLRLAAGRAPQLNPQPCDKHIHQG